MDVVSTGGRAAILYMKAVLADMRTTQCEPYRLRSGLASEADLVQGNTYAVDQILTSHGLETSLCNGAGGATRLGRPCNKIIGP